MRAIPLETEKQIYLMFCLGFPEDEISKRFKVGSARRIVFKIQKDFQKYFKNQECERFEKAYKPEKYSLDEKYAAFKLRKEQGLEYMTISIKTGICSSMIPKIMKDPRLVERYEKEIDTKNKGCDK